jgi:hypothetical protein
VMPSEPLRPTQAGPKALLRAQLPWPSPAPSRYPTAASMYCNNNLLVGTYS